MNSETMPYVEAGLRTVTCYARLTGKVYALPYGGKRYRGEAYLLKNRGNATITLFSPNRVEVAINVTGADTLIVNQNFDKNWKAEDGINVETHRGLLSARVTPDVRTVKFYYLPDLFLYGALLTSLGLTIIIAAILRYGPHIFSASNDENAYPSTP